MYVTGGSTAYVIGQTNCFSDTDIIFIIAPKNTLFDFVVHRIKHSAEYIQSRHNFYLKHSYTYTSTPTRSANIILVRKIEDVES